MVPDSVGWRDPRPRTWPSHGQCRAAGRHTHVRRARRQGCPRDAYFLLRRWMRVFFSSLRCFFLAILLRRFLMTEPTVYPHSTVRKTATPPCARPDEGG